MVRNGETEGMEGEWGEEMARENGGRQCYTRGRVKWGAGKKEWGGDER